jgi:glutamine synthetase
MSEKQKLALSQPVAVILDKKPEEFRRKDFLKLIELKQLERITFHYVGLDGKLKELKIPVTSLSQAETILAEGERVDGFSL